MHDPIKEETSYRNLKKQCVEEIEKKERLSQNALWSGDRKHISTVNKHIGTLLWSCFKQAREEKQYLNAAKDFLSAFELNHPKAIALYDKKTKKTDAQKIRVLKDTDIPEQLLHQGLCHQLGLGRRQNRAKAVALYERAALLGHPTAMYFMSYAYQFGRGVKQNKKEYIKWLKWSAEAGFARAQNELGERYREGKGVDENSEKAVNWFRLAAEQNLSEAQNNLADAYFKGRGVQTNPNIAEHWWTLAANQGNPLAQYNLGKAYWDGLMYNQTNRPLGLKWLRQAAEQGISQAQDRLGDAYWYGREVPEDKVEAVKWYHLAASQENSDAQYSLGFAYLHGQGATQDLDMAKYWLEKSANNGNASAQYCYGKALYWERFNGDDAMQAANAVEGIKWLEKAANAGYLKAQTEFEDVYEDKPKKYLPWLRLAADQGDKNTIEKLKNLDHPLAKYHTAWIEQDAKAVINSFFLVPENLLHQTFTENDLPKALKSKKGRVFIEQIIDAAKEENASINHTFLINMYNTIRDNSIAKNQGPVDYYLRLLSKTLKLFDFTSIDKDSIATHFHFLLDAWWSNPKDFTNLEQLHALWYRAHYVKSPCLTNTGLLRQLASLLVSYFFKTVQTVNVEIEINASQVEVLFSLVKLPTKPDATLINTLLGVKLIIPTDLDNRYAFFNGEKAREGATLEVGLANVCSL